ncbi:stage II sporulation protein M [Candidatus Bathyarchaeota archaeon]|nr:stage II sporulation protein M [Candidatus Bathyarchaeota archaeon]
MRFSFWEHSSSRLKRIMMILAFLFLSILVTLAGVLTPLSLGESQQLNEQLKQLQDSLKGNDVWHNALLIFQNNILICLIMFVPVLGLFFGFYVLYNTGLVIAAQSNVANVSATMSFLLLFLFPHTLLEFTAYSTALAESVWLPWRLIRHKEKRELVKAGLLILLCAAILLVAALVESVLITPFL